MNQVKENSAEEFLELLKRLEVYKACGRSVVRTKKDKKPIFADLQTTNRYQNWFAHPAEYRRACFTLNGLLKLKVKP